MSRDIDLLQQNPGADTPKGNLDPPSMRRRLIDMLYGQLLEAGNQVTVDETAGYVDAILRELMEPTEVTLAAGDNALPPRHDDESLAIWQAMLQHILNEGRSARISHHGRTDEKQREA